MIAHSCTEYCENYHVTNSQGSLNQSRFSTGCQKTKESHYLLIPFGPFCEPFLNLILCRHSFCMFVYGMFVYFWTSLMGELLWSLQVWMVIHQIYITIYFNKHCIINRSNAEMEEVTQLFHTWSIEVHIDHRDNNKSFNAIMAQTLLVKMKSLSLFNILWRVKITILCIIRCQSCYHKWWGSKWDTGWSQYPSDMNHDFKKGLNHKGRTKEGSCEFFFWALLFQENGLFPITVYCT